MTSDRTALSTGVVARRRTRGFSRNEDCRVSAAIPVDSAHHRSSPHRCNVGVLWPNGWTHQDETWQVGRPRPWPHCARWGPRSPSPKGAQLPIFGPYNISKLTSPSEVSISHTTLGNVCQTCLCIFIFIRRNIRSTTTGVNTNIKEKELN